jgi:DNA-binding CsgD family transcriptional regulator
LRQLGEGHGALATALLERESELAAVGMALRAAAEGVGRPVSITGPPGIGKTRLAQAACRQGEMIGFRVCQARGTELERGFAFGLARQLLEPVLAGSNDEDRARLLRGPAAGAEAVFSPQPGSVIASPDPEYGRLHALYWLAANMSECDPLLLVIDDAQWADEASIRFLSFLAPRLDGLSLLLVLSSRTGEEGVPLRSELNEHPDLVAIEPGPLSTVAVTGLLRERLGDDVSPQVVDACRRVTGGNPFLVHELALELEERDDHAALDALTVEAMGPRRVEHSIRTRVARLGSKAEAVAEALAVLGEGVALTDLARFTGLEQRQADAIADGLAGVHVLEPARPLRFAHPILRAAIYGGLAEGTRGSLHARAARLLSDSGDIDAAAAHLLSAPVQDADWAIETLRRAGTVALARGEPRAARELYERALLEQPTGEERAEILFEVARAAGQAGEPDAIALLRETLALAGTLELRLGAFTELAMALHFLDQAEEAIDVSVDALREVPANAPQIAAPLRAILLIGAHHTPGTRRKTVGAIRELAERSRDAQTPVELAHLALELVVVDGDPERACVAAERSFADGLIDLVTSDFPSVYSCASALTLAERYDSADRWLGVAIEDARRRSSARAYAPASAFRAWNSLRTGRLSEAEADAAASLELLATDHIIRPVAASALIGVLTERGAIAEARRVRSELDVGALRADLFALTLFEEQSAALCLAEGNPKGALEHARRLGEWESAMGYRADAWIAIRPLQATALRLLDRPADALEAAEAAVAAARELGSGRVLGVALRTQAQCSDHDRREHLLLASEAALRSSGAAAEHARTLIELGAETRRSGRRADAQEWLDAGLEIALRCRARALAEQAYEELAAAGIRRRKMLDRGVEALTASELRVTRLAADGKTNREIAQDLFVSIKTVEFHLSNAYRKLEASSRSDLPALLPSR